MAGCARWYADDQPCADQEYYRNVLKEDDEVRTERREGSGAVLTTSAEHADIHTYASILRANTRRLLGGRRSRWTKDECE